MTTAALPRGRGAAPGAFAPSALEPSLLGYVWRYSKREQLVILLLTVSTFPLMWISLELPKIIVNDAIQGEGFPREVLGVDLAQIPYLLSLCVAFLATVVAINGLKWLMNVSVGLTGERMLRRLRQQLFTQVLRFPPGRLRRLRPGETVQSMLGEVEPIGGFFGETIATPVMQGGMLAVYVGFIFAQDVVLGLAALSLYPVQMALIPRLQRKVVRLNRERATNTRKLADALSGAIDGMDDIRAHGAQRWRLAQIAAKLHVNTRIRKELFRRKFTIKFVNNFLNQLTPFFFYSIGGAMVISGRLDLGSLVAVLAAYKDISKPWRELLNYQQRLTDYRGRFAYAVENFGGHDLARPERILPERAGEPLGGALEMSGVETAAGGGLTVGSLKARPGETLAALGGEGGARSAFLRLAVGLDWPAAGRVTLGGVDLEEVDSLRLGAAMGYVAPDAAIDDGSIRDNILYGLQRRPRPLDARDDAEAAEMRREAELTGAPTDDPTADWVDPAAAGCADHAALRGKVAALADAAGMGPELIAAALAARLDSPGAMVLANAAGEVRGAIVAELEAQGLADAVEPWRRDEFAEGGSLLENVLFALPRRDPGEADASAEALENDEVRAALAAAGAEDLLADVGADIARELAALAADVGLDSAALDRLGGYGRADAAAAAALVARLPAKGRDATDRKMRATLIALGARFTPTRDRFDVLGPERRAEALRLRAACEPRARKAASLARFDDADPPPFFTIAEFLSGGRPRRDRRSAWRRLDSALESAIEAAGLRMALIEAGLGRPAGPAGASLSPGMRRRIALVRALVKRPALVVLDGVACGASEEDRGLRALSRRAAPSSVILYAASDEAAAADADAIARIDGAGALRREPVADQRKPGREA